MVRPRDQNDPRNAGEARPFVCTCSKETQRFTISDLAWSHLGEESAETLEVAENSDVFRYLLNLLTPQPTRDEMRV